MKHQRLRRVAWLLVPLWIWLVADVVLTLASQSPAYWAGHYQEATEGNPLAYQIMLHGPLAFIVSAIAWAAMVSALIGFCRATIASWLAVIVTFLHIAGGSSWLIRSEKIGWPLAVGYIYVAGKLSMRCWRYGAARSATRLLPVAEKQ